jgi:hypothetical protein
VRLGFLSPPGDGQRIYELRGDAQPGAIPIGPRRSLYVTEAAAEPPAGRVYEVTAGLAIVEVVGERLMRRLTELDLDRLPAIGSVARGVTTVVERTGADRFRLLVPRELAQYVAEVVADLEQGLAQ